MGRPFDNWWHVILGTRSSWLPGDPRGFRDHNHRIHSSGDYRDPPPEAEHQALHDYAQHRAAEAIRFRERQREIVLDALQQAASVKQIPLLAASVGDVHAHVLVRATDSYPDAKATSGKLKVGSSYLLRDTMPGRIWGSGTSPKPVRDPAHLRNTFFYIRDRQERYARTWGNEEHLRDVLQRVLGNG